MATKDMFQNTFRWLVVSGLLASLVLGDHYYGNQPAAVRLLAILLALSLALFVFKGTTLGQRAWQFLSEARTELKKVVWPTRNETGQATLLVMVVVTIAALFFWMIDGLLLKTVGLITGYGA